jgi:pimeloyl-ACP methyl ester carboxylesterase
MLPRAVLPLLALLLVLAAPAAAQERTVTVRGFDGPGPSRYDRVTVTKIGSASARTVLVLVPGTSGGAGDFTLVGRDIVRRLPGVQVWAVDRRSQALEDTSVFREGLAGRRTLRQVFDYYLGWLTDQSIQPRFQPIDPARFGFARDWGLRVQLEDLRRVVLSARRQGRRVVLGGHSLGASVTAAYATWDFAGRPGHRDIDGMVLIDGGLLGTFDTDTAAGFRRQLRELRRGSPFADLLGVGLPWAAGVFAQVGGLYALREPTAESPLQDFALLPQAFRPPVRVTNRGLFGYAFDQTTSPEALDLISVRAGALGPGGDWQDGEVTPVGRLAEFFAQEPVNAIEWYFPRRLTIDVDGASSLSPRGEVSRLLGLRTRHLRSVDVPLYAFQTDLTEGRVLRGARRFIARSDVPRRRSVLVDRGSSTSHLDPLTAAPETNDFLQTLVPFLRRLRR